MGVNLCDLDVNPRIVTAVKNAGFREGGQVLRVASAELERLTGLSASDVTHLKDAVSHALMPSSFVTALDLWRAENNETTRSGRLTTGCPQLDQALRGGLLVRGLTEVCGESGAGKTQLCLQLCLTVQLPPAHGGLDGGAVYISTEGAFPAKRLHQMAHWFCQRHRSLLAHKPTDRVLLEHVAHWQGLKDCVHRRLPLAMTRGGVKLVVVDSVAALLRCGNDDDNHDGNNDDGNNSSGYSLVGRAKQLAALATDLRSLAQQHNIVVVCVNQVTANMSRAWKGPGEQRQSIPALGLVWADHLTCRLLLSRRQHHHHQQKQHQQQQQQQQLQKCPMTDPSSETKSELSGQSEASSTRVGGDSVLVTERELEVVFAPHLPHCVLPLVIDNTGLRHSLA